MKVNKVKCVSCPFNKNGCQDIRRTVESRGLEVSQMCHHTDNKTLCRGSRDYQLNLLHMIQFLEEPTDECWDKKLKEIK